MVWKKDITKAMLEVTNNTFSDELKGIHPRGALTKITSLYDRNSPKINLSFKGFEERSWKNELKNYTLGIGIRDIEEDVHGTLCQESQAYRININNHFYYFVNQQVFATENKSRFGELHLLDHTKDDLPYEKRDIGAMLNRFKEFQDSDREIIDLSPLCQEVFSQYEHAYNAVFDSTGF